MSVRIIYLVLVMSILSIYVPAQKMKAERKIDPKSDYGMDVINEINGIRRTPDKYRRYLEEYLERMRGDVLYLPKRAPFKLWEGDKVIKDAAKFLAESKRLPPLKRSELLECAAASQLADLLENPKLGHSGKDSAGLAKRLGRFGNRQGPAGENITYSDETPRQVALTMIIDDGVESRMHRKNVTNPEYLIAGAACGRTTENRSICVTIFARQIVPFGTDAPSLEIEEFE